MLKPNLNHKEKFILNILKEKRNGFYVELGGSHFLDNNNTYKLESYYDWDSSCTAAGIFY